MRFLTSAALAMTGLLIVAWLCSAAQPRMTVERGPNRIDVTLIDGVLSIQESPRSRYGPISRDEYHLNASIGRDQSPMKWWPLQVANGAHRHTLVPFAPLLLLAMCVAAGIPALLALKHRRRLQANRCLICGHQRIGSSPCQECGRSIDGARQQAAIRIGRIVNQAAIMALVVLGVLVMCVRGFVALERKAVAADRARTLDYAWYLQACTPLLTGDVVFASPGEGPTSLKSIMSQGSGTATIVLLPGEHVINPSQMMDIRIIGAGREHTKLTIDLDRATRVAIEGLTIDVKHRPFADLRDGGSLLLRDCLIRGYGEQSHRAMLGNETVFLVDRCEFDGTSTRRTGQPSATAIEAREGRIYARDTTFCNNRTDLEMYVGVIDACTLSSATQTRHDLVRSYDNSYVHDTTIPLPPGAGLVGYEFSERMDDVEALTRMAHGASPESAWSDPIARKAAIARNADVPRVFWPRLLLHPNPEVRALAKSKVTLPPLPFTPLPLEAALTRLDATPMPREVVLGILDNEEAARPRLEALKASGTPNEQGNASALLILMDVEPSLPDVVRAAPLRERP